MSYLEQILGKGPAVDAEQQCIDAFVKQASEEKVDLAKYPDEQVNAAYGDFRQKWAAAQAGTDTADSIIEKAAADGASDEMLEKLALAKLSGEAMFEGYREAWEKFAQEMEAAAPAEGPPPEGPPPEAPPAEGGDVTQEEAQAIVDSASAEAVDEAVAAAPPEASSEEIAAAAAEMVPALVEEKVSALIETKKQAACSTGAAGIVARVHRKKEAAALLQEKLTKEAVGGPLTTLRAAFQRARLPVTKVTRGVGGRLKKETRPGRSIPGAALEAATHTARTHPTAAKVTGGVAGGAALAGGVAAARKKKEAADILAAKLAKELGR